MSLVVVDPVLLLLISGNWRFGALVNERRMKLKDPPADMSVPQEIEIRLSNIDSEKMGMFTWRFDVIGVLYAVIMLQRLANIAEVSLVPRLCTCILLL